MPDAPDARTDSRIGRLLAIAAGFGLFVWLSICLLLAPLLQGAAYIGRLFGRLRRRLKDR